MLNNSEIDVLHISWYYEYGGSISKIIENIKNNSKLNNYIMSLPESLSTITGFININKPKILHLHFNSFPQKTNFLNELKYKPYIIQTIHGNATSSFIDKVDKIICIHDSCYKLNPKDKSIIIENSVDVEQYRSNKTTMINSVISTFRCIPERIDEEVMKVYSQIKSPVFLYGYFDNDRHSNKLIKELSLKYGNIIAMPWEKNVEKFIPMFSIYSFYLTKKMNHEEYCYGLSVMEAASLGVPIVTIIRNQNYQKFVIDKYNGFICDNADNFIDACNKLINDQIMYKQIKENALAHSYNIKNSMPLQYEELYKNYLF